MAETKPAAHAGYASGSKTLNLATWTAAVERLLAATETVDVFGPGPEKKPIGTRLAHETDPPEHVQWTPRSPRPGPLPRLVAERDIAPAAKILEHELTIVLGDEPDLDLICYHNSRVCVLEARRVNAKGLALRAPRRNESGNVVLEFVLVL